MRGSSVLGAAAALGMGLTAVSAGEPESQRAAAEKLPAGYEILSADARWCGPRILFFFSCYYGMERTLDEVVQLCATDEAGLTAMADLVRAARALDLDPMPVEATVDEVVHMGRPAILCLTSGQGDAAPARGSLETSRVHFVGLVRPAEEGRYWFVDPSMRAVAFPASLESLGNRYTGHAVLLKGSSTVLVWPSWLDRFSRGMLAVLVLILCSVVLVKRLGIGGAKRGEGKS